jgi:hypothetical protein
MIANMTTNGANWMSMSGDPKPVAPLAWAKAGVMNKGYNSEDGYFAACQGFPERAAYIPSGAAKATAPPRLAGRARAEIGVDLFVQSS